MVFDGLQPGRGVLFEELSLNDRIGPEAVALMIEDDPSSLLAKRRLNLNLKAGIAETVFGPVMFLIWWIPPLVNGRPFAFYEQLLNPLHPGTTHILQQFADQTHLHMLLLDQTGKVHNLFEFENTFGFDHLKACAENEGLGCDENSNFELAKVAYEASYDPTELLRS